MPNEIHMQMAAMATAWVRKTLPVGADNNYTRHRDRPSETVQRDVQNRLDTSRYLLGQLIALLQQAPNPNEELTETQVAARNQQMALQYSEVTTLLKAGNCHEQAMCAYRWLTGRAVPGVKMVQVSMQPYFNDKHVFVVIGAAATGTELSNLGDIVVCDPWLGEAVKRNPSILHDHPKLARGAFAGTDYAGLLAEEGLEFARSTNKITVLLPA